jgi:cell division protein FtsI (penicillin-binding protein 3)
MKMNKDRRRDREMLARQRLRWVMAGGAVFWLVLVGRLVQVQGLQHADYAARAKDQYERRVELKASRGSIFDRRGRELAMDIETVSFAGDPMFVDQPEQVARHFVEFSKQDPESLVQQLKSSRRFVYLARQLPKDDLARARSQLFSGVSEYPETQRHYPYGNLAGQLLGHTNIDNVGREGVERAFDDLLRETNGSVLSYVDARGQQVPGMQQERQNPRNGGSLVLTIDAVYQDILEEELARAIQSSGAESGIGVISHPKTGEILAMANVPLYDPNEPGQAPARLRRNRALTDPFEPGSTFKVIAAAAVLEDELATSDERVFCEDGKLILGDGGIIRDAHPYGLLSYREVLEKSSNIGIIKFARRLKRKRFYEYIRNFGFGIRSGVDLPAESAGLLEHASSWSDRSLETIAMGQEISATALQLVQAFGAIANGGVLLAPRILKATLGADGEVIEETPPQPIRRVVSESTAAELRKILAGAVRNGTGRRAQLEGVAVAGKTGTAQRVTANGKGYDPDANVVSFIGFLPADDPELLCLVVIDNPQKDKWGGHTAAPAFRRIVERVAYLANDLLVVRPRVVAPGDTVGLILPDLRGTTRQVARFQAGLRGLSVDFFGEGGVVVRQEPEPGVSGKGVFQIACIMGKMVEGTVARASDIPLRQALLLRNLKKRSFVAEH